MNNSLLKFGTVAVLALCTTSAFGYAKITKLEASAQAVTLQGGSATVKFTVIGEADENDSCGLYMRYGEGETPDTRIVSKADGLFPRTFEHTFRKAGTYVVSAKGERVKTTFGCNGEATVTITVSAPAGASGAAPKSAPGCPEGWELVKGSFNKKTGAFSCTAVAPAKKIDCGSKLAYFEKGGTIGCRAGK